LKRRLELAEAVRALQAELARATRVEAMSTGPMAEAQFPVTGVHLEFHVAVTKTGKDWTGVKFWVVEPGREGKLAGEEIHTVAVTLGTPVDLTGRELEVAAAPHISTQSTVLAMSAGQQEKTSRHRHYLKEDPMEDSIPTTEPTLTKASITFQTADDDKHEESVLHMRLFNKSGNIVARANDAYEKFPNLTTNGPYDLNVLTEAPLSSVKAGGSFILTWTPWFDEHSGNTDKWNFSLFLDLVFSDSQHVTLDQHGLTLATSFSNSLTFGL
jgi:hypothetical protein